jgi:hypothetical protein
MANFTSAFTPALNKDGFAHLTFDGLSVKEGITQTKDKDGNCIVDEETGEIQTKEWKITSFVFIIKGRVRGTTQKVYMNVGEKFSEASRLGKTLTNMGFVTPEVETVNDEDGFAVESTDIDDDGFDDVEGDLIPDAIESFIEESKGKVFIGKPVRSKKGFLDIDVDTLKPFKK